MKNKDDALEDPAVGDTAPSGDTAPTEDTAPDVATSPDTAPTATVVTLASEEQPVDTSNCEIPEGVRVGAFVGVDPGKGTPTSYKRMPLLPTE